MLADLDLRWITALSQGLIGVFLIVLAVRVWWMPLGRRAQLFGPFLSEEGFKLLFRSWPLVFLFGLFLFMSGLSKWAYYGRWQGTVATETANGIGILEAIISAWAAGSLAVVAVRIWRGS